MSSPFRLDSSNKFLDTASIHLHVPEGATPKAPVQKILSYKYFIVDDTLVHSNIV